MLVGEAVSCPFFYVGPLTRVDTRVYTPRTPTPGFLFVRPLLIRIRYVDYTFSNSFDGVCNDVLVSFCRPAAVNSSAILTAMHGSMYLARIRTRFVRVVYMHVVYYIPGSGLRR